MEASLVAQLRFNCCVRVQNTYVRVRILDGAPSLLLPPPLALYYQSPEYYPTTITVRKFRQVALLVVVGTLTAKNRTTLLLPPPLQKKPTAKKTCGTRYSRVVPDHSTDRARPGLAEEIGRDPAFPGLNGRKL